MEEEIIFEKPKKSILFQNTFLPNRNFKNTMEFQLIETIRIPLVETIILPIPNLKPILESEKSITLLETQEEKTLNVINNIDIEKISEKRTSHIKNKTYSAAELKKIAKQLGINTKIPLNKKELAALILDYINKNKK